MSWPAVPVMVLRVGCALAVIMVLAFNCGNLLVGGKLFVSVATRCLLLSHAAAVLADRYGQCLEFSADSQLALDLRKTLWHWKLGNVLVFEREEHLERFRERAKGQNKVLYG